MSGLLAPGVRVPFPSHEAHVYVIALQEQGSWTSLSVTGPQGRYGLGDSYCFLDNVRFHSDHACGLVPRACAQDTLSSSQALLPPHKLLITDDMPRFSSGLE